MKSRRRLLDEMDALNPDCKNKRTGGRESLRHVLGRRPTAQDEEQGGERCQTQNENAGEHVQHGFIAWKHRSERDRSYIQEVFPYIGWLRDHIHTYLPSGATEFYNDYWRDKAIVSRSEGKPKMQKQNTAFFNFCKAVIAKHDSASAADVFALEALNRFIASCFYALVIALCIIVLELTTILVTGGSLRLGLTLLVIGAIYGSLIIGLLGQYRYLRCKEVSTLYYACVINREHFDSLFPERRQREIGKLRLLGDPEV